VDVRAARIGHNEALFREVNERVERLTQEFQTTAEPMQILCECGDRECRERIELTVEEYEALRKDPAHFAVAPGHEAPDVERVIKQRGTYDIVRKFPGPPTRLAEATDPRS
jgi:hypothetical protein